MEKDLADLTYLKQVTANSKAMMRLFINAYLQCAPDCMKQLEQRLNEKNWPGLKKAAHTFKPQVKYMGLVEIIPLIQEVEDSAAYEINLDALVGKVQRINAVGTKAMVELRRTLIKLDAEMAE